ncbi:unnamed protein product [Phyllotreta striolata]|uniref:ODAD1 central coiled coil region domain-containing protein n=1 Tax=Phyllotreta striolata TaxID=444603 RepID=A0A9N9XTH9_PHYSR|nr:unnamed protein product [Phyllotreta striolata]
MSRRKKVELTEEEKFELAKQAEQELARMCRNYTLLERNRNQKGDKGGTLLKQKRVLDIFRDEQLELLTDLRVATAGARVFEDDKNCDKIKDLLDECDEFDEEIKHQEFHLEEIEGQMTLNKKKLVDLSAKQVTDEKYYQRVVQGDKTVHKLENQLEVQVKKFCHISADNIDLREEIRYLLHERKEFNKLWDKLIENLCSGRKFMFELIEQATIAYDQREDWVNQLQLLRQKAHHDLINHINEIKTMQKKIDDDVKLQEFFSVKNQKRLMRDLEEKEKKKRRINRENMEKRLERYLQILLAVKEFANEDRVQIIANNFIAQEEENFAMFKCINSLNGDMESITDRLANLQMQIDAQQELNEVRRKQQGVKLENLQAEYKRVKEIAENKKEELRVVNDTLKDILSSINALFKMFGCKSDPIVRLLGHNQSINNYNALLYLEILERNIVEAMVGNFYKERIIEEKTSRDVLTMVEETNPPLVEPISRIVTSTPCALCLEHDQVLDVIDILQFAMTKEEAQAKVRERINDAESCLHNVSACHLPKSRQIVQKRYQ